MQEPEKNDNEIPESERERFRSAVFEDSFHERDKVFAELKKRQKKQEKIIIIVAVVASSLMLILFVVNLIFSSDDLFPYQSMKWSEPKTACGTIKAAVDTYRAKMSGDISGLDTPKGELAEGFVSGSQLLAKLRLHDLAFEGLQYFDSDDFVLEFVTDGKDGEYIITVDAAIGINGGASGTGPSSGTGSYNSATGKWTGSLE